MNGKKQYVLGENIIVEQEESRLVVKVNGRTFSLYDGS